MNRKKDAPTVLVYGVLIFITLVCLFPIVRMCLIFMKSTSESITGFNSPMVSNPTMANFKRPFEMVPVGQNAFNSVFTTIMGTIISLFFCVLVSFAFTKYRFPGRRFLFCFVIATMLVPLEVGSVPLFITIKEVGLINSLWSLMIPRIAATVGIFYMSQYTTDAPDELVEAARIDGRSDFGIFTEIIPPVIEPAMASQGAITLIARWNDFFQPLLHLRRQTKYTLMMTISLLPVSERLSTPWPVMLAGTTLVIVPIIILCLTLEKFQKAGMMEDAVKG